MDRPKEGEQVELKVIIHDDGKAFHVRPLVPKEDGAEYQCNKYERITTMVEPTDLSDGWVQISAYSEDSDDNSIEYK